MRRVDIEPTFDTILTRDRDSHREGGIDPSIGRCLLDGCDGGYSDQRREAQNFPLFRS